jgi:uncharacterized membrane protein
MRTSASIGKHPVHPMLMVFPIGLWIFSLICDAIGLSVATPGVWFTVALDGCAFALAVMLLHQITALEGNCAAQSRATLISAVGI